MVDFMADGKRYSAMEVRDIAQADQNAWYYMHNNGKDYIFYHKKDNGKDKYYFGREYKVSPSGAMTGGSFYENPAEFISGLALGESPQSNPEEQNDQPQSSPSVGESDSCKIGFSGAINNEYVDKLAKSSTEAAEKLLENDVLKGFEDKKDCVSSATAEEIRKVALALDPSLKGDGKISDSAYSYGIQYFVENFKAGEPSKDVMSPEEFKKVLDPSEEFSVEAFKKSLADKKIAAEKLKQAKIDFDKFKVEYDKAPEQIEKLSTAETTAKKDRDDVVKALEVEKKELSFSLEKQREALLKKFLDENLKSNASEALKQRAVELFEASYEEDTAEIKKKKADVSRMNDLLLKKNESLEKAQATLAAAKSTREEGLTSKTKELEELKKLTEKLETEPERIVAGIHESYEDRLKAQRKISSIVNEINAFFNGDTYDFSDFIRSKEDLIKYMQPEYGMDEIKRAFMRGIRKKQSEKELAILDADPNDPRNESGEIFICEKEEAPVTGQTQQGNVSMEKDAYSIDKIASGDKVKVHADGKVSFGKEGSDLKTVQGDGVTVVSKDGKKYELKDGKIISDGKEVDSLPVEDGAKVYLDEDKWQEKKWLGAPSVVNQRLRKLDLEEKMAELNKPNIEGFSTVKGYEYLGSGRMLGEAPGEETGSTAVLKDVKLPESWESEKDARYDVRVHDFGPETAVYVKKKGQEGAEWRRIDRFAGEDGKKMAEGVMIMHHPDQEKSGKVYAFKGGYKYLLDRADLDCISEGSCDWASLKDKRIIGPERIDFSLSESDKKGQKIEFAMPNNERLENGLFKDESKRVKEKKPATEQQTPQSSEQPQRQIKLQEQNEEQPSISLPQAQSQVIPPVTGSTQSESAQSAPSGSSQSQSPSTSSSPSTTAKADLSGFKFIIYGGTTCGPCKKLKAVLAEYQKNSSASKPFVMEVKNDQMKDITGMRTLTVYPTIHILKDNQEYLYYAGQKDEEGGDSGVGTDDLNSIMVNLNNQFFKGSETFKVD